MRKLSPKELLLVFIDSFVGLEYKHKKKLFESLSNGVSIKKFILDNKDYISSEIGVNEYNTLINSANDAYLDFVLKSLDKRGLDVVTIESENYPERLKNTPIPPLVLYAKGDVSLLNSLSLGVVGSRKSLPVQIAIADNFCEQLSKNGFTLVTGTAEGIDSVALKSASKYGAKVISVMAGGFDHIYPSSNKSLLDSVIANGGLVITEHVAEVVCKPYLFPVRNRIIAGLSDGVLVVSASLKSGTVYTARYAEEYSKKVYAVPYNPGIESGKGCNDLIKCGVKLADCPQDILSDFNINVQDKEGQETTLNDEQRQIISLLKDGEMHIEKISQKLNMPTFELLPILAELEILGKVVKTGVNVFGIIG